MLLVCILNRSTKKIPHIREARTHLGCIVESLEDVAGSFRGTQIYTQIGYPTFSHEPKKLSIVKYFSKSNLPSNSRVSPSMSISLYIFPSHFKKKGELKNKKCLCHSHCPGFNGFNCKAIEPIFFFYHFIMAT